MQYFNNTELYYLEAGELKGGPERGEIIKFALVNILPSIVLVTTCSWLLADRELSSFFKLKGENSHWKLALEVLNS